MEVICFECKVKMKLVLCKDGDGVDTYECPKCKRKDEKPCDFDEEYS